MIAVKDKAAVDLVSQAQLVTMTIAGQLFGIPVFNVWDILNPQRITPVPLAPPEIAGSLNLRGRIVTAIEVCTRLGLPPRTKQASGMNVVVQHQDEFYSLIVDKVGEIMMLNQTAFELSPPTLDARLRDVASGIYRLKDNLLVVLDVARLLQFDEKATA